MLVPERCQSGRLGRSRKPLWSSALRGFEDNPLRHWILEFKTLRVNLGEVVQRQLDDFAL